MHASTLLFAGIAALASATPIAIRDDATNDNFQIQNFVFGCTTTCDYSYDVTYTGVPTSHCTGSKGENGSNGGGCTSPSSTQTITSYIDENNTLHLEYEYTEPPSYRYTFLGNTSVNAATSGKPQPTDFYVPVSVAYAVG